MDIIVTNNTQEIIVNSGGYFYFPTPINGKSAYDLAVENGFVGTEIEWLNSLKTDVILWSSTNW